MTALTRGDGTTPRAGVAPWLYVLAIVAVLVVVAEVELGMGREPMCTCGFISLWHGAVDSQNSQQIADWYTFTHIEHGLGFYALLFLVARRLPMPLRLLLAVGIEGAWEIAENSPFIIDRYRTATLSLDYYGDSVLNSVCDIGWMILGFVLASRLPVWATIVLIVVAEFGVGYAIRDNLALNILMLIYPLDAVRRWQAGG